MVFKFIHLFTDKEDIAIFAKKWFNYLPRMKDTIIYDNTMYIVEDVTFNLNCDTIQIYIRELDKLNDKQAKTIQYLKTETLDDKNKREQLMR